MVRAIDSYEGSDLASILMQAKSCLSAVSDLYDKLQELDHARDMLSGKDRPPLLPYLRILTGIIFLLPIICSALAFVIFTFFGWPMVIVVALLSFLLWIFLIVFTVKRDNREVANARDELEIKQMPEKERILQDIDKQWVMLSQLPSIPKEFLEIYTLTKFANYLYTKEASKWKECIKAWKDDQQRTYVKKRLDEINDRTKSTELAAKFAAWNSFRR